MSEYKKQENDIQISNSILRGPTDQSVQSSQKMLEVQELLQKQQDQETALQQKEEELAKKEENLKKKYKSIEKEKRTKQDDRRSSEVMELIQL